MRNTTQAALRFAPNPYSNCIGVERCGALIPCDFPHDIERKVMTRDINGKPYVIQMDNYIAQQKRDLSHLEFDDPDFDVVNERLIEAYAALAAGEAYHVRF